MITNIPFLSWCLGLIAIAVGYAIVRTLQHYQKVAFVTEYAFFLRIPILLGVLAVAIPVLGPRWLEAILGNLYVIDDPLAVFVAVVLSGLCSWAIVYTGVLIGHSVPIRCRLYFRLSTQIAVRNDPNLAPVPPAQVVGRWPTLGVVALTLPTAWVLVANSPHHPCRAALMVILGLIAMVVVHVLAECLANLFLDTAGQKVGDGFVTFLDTKVIPGPRAKHAGTIPPSVMKAYRRMHVKAFVFAFLSLLFYGILGAAQPGYSKTWVDVPAVTYLLAGIVVIDWGLGYLSLLWDRARIPVLATIATVLTVWSFIWPTGNHYAIDEGSRARPGKASEALNAFVDQNQRKIVVVTASGGGIAAAYWAATVIEGISRTPGLGDRGFNQRVALVSTVSGGSVGMMYYIDGFTGGLRPYREPDWLSVPAGTGSLSATTWALAYPDLFRPVAGALLTKDRGWVQERRWGDGLSDRSLKLRSWGESVLKAQRPLMVMNATLQESGQRFVLAPLRLPPGALGGAAEFYGLYPGCDIDVVTAARLSATFPYVSPQASPDLRPSSLFAAFHASDGGYYDNSGIETALCILNAWIAEPNNQRPAKLALVEIQMGDSSVEAYHPDSDSIVSSVGGPLLTLYNVRGPSQTARDEAEFKALQKIWRRKKIDAREFQFVLGGDQALSWQLTDAQKQSIESNWPSPGPAPAKPQEPIYAQANRAVLGRLGDFLKD